MVSYEWKKKEKKIIENRFSNNLSTGKKNEKLDLTRLETEIFIIWFFALLIKHFLVRRGAKETMDNWISISLETPVVISFLDV